MENSKGLAYDIINTINTIVGSRKPISVLEVGGAPGGYLVHFARHYGAEIHSIDYSEVGCRATEENFRILGYPVTTHEIDIFAVGTDFPRFDIVYSLGLIEHFTDTEQIVKAHRNLLKPNGLLILGVPHFVDVFWPLLHLLAPHVTEGHNRKALTLKHWVDFEQVLGLTTIHKSYLGGFQPWLMSCVIREEYASGGGRFKPLGRLLMWCLRLVYSARQRYPRATNGVGMGSVNGELVSAYAIAAYTTTEN